MFLTSDDAHKLLPMFIPRRYSDYITYASLSSHFTASMFLKSLNNDCLPEIFTTDIVTNYAFRTYNRFKFSIQL